MSKEKIITRLAAIATATAIAFTPSCGYTFGKAEDFKPGSSITETQAEETTAETQAEETTAETKAVETTAETQAVETTAALRIEDVAALLASILSSQEEGQKNETTRETAELKNGKYILHDSDGNPVEVDLSKAIGFTPDKDLIVSDLKPKALGTEPASVTRDFQEYLNTSRDGFGPLAGYTDGTNDYNQYGNNESNPQVPAYSWMIHTGLNVDMLGIGKVEGGEGRAVSVLIINRTDKVFRFPTESVTVEAGFQGWGPLFNGESKEVVETERRLVNHYDTRLGEGVPESGFIGQTDQGAENATSVTVVTIELVQWGNNEGEEAAIAQWVNGNNEDGTPRYQFRLIRAETVPAIK